MPFAEQGALFLSASEATAELYRAHLERAGFSSRTATRASAIRAQQGPEFTISVIIVDLDLANGAQGLDALKEAVMQGVDAPVIVLTATGSITLAVEAMRLGADDFLVKPVSPQRLVKAAKESTKSRARRQMKQLSSKTSAAGASHGFIGDSEQMQCVYREIEAVAPSHATVFITGESGVGKEVAAETIHRLSHRGTGPFVAINCGAIPGELISSELFGHVKGSFTGAVADRVGAVRQADGGTLFLDEICEMRLDLQTELLRFLQTGAFRPVGATRTERVDVRILCATNRDPRHEIAEKRFREDLYYRLHVVPLHLPPLRCRARDVIALAEAFLQRFAKENDRKRPRFSPDAHEKLLSYHWPGNVRELQNVVQNAVVMHEADVVSASMLRIPKVESGPECDGAAALRGLLAAMHEGSGAPAASNRGPDAPKHPDLWTCYDDMRMLSELETSAMRAAMRICRENVNLAAFHLGVSPSTIYRKRLRSA